MPDSDSEAFESADEDVAAEEKTKKSIKINQKFVKIKNLNFFSSNSA